MQTTTIPRLAKLLDASANQARQIGEDYRSGSVGEHYMSARLLRYMMTELRIIAISSPSPRQDILNLLRNIDGVTLATMQLKIDTGDK